MTSTFDVALVALLGNDEYRTKDIYSPKLISMQLVLDLRRAMATVEEMQRVSDEMIQMITQNHPLSSHQLASKDEASTVFNAFTLRFQLPPAYNPSRDPFKLFEPQNEEHASLSETDVIIFSCDSSDAAFCELFPSHKG